MNILMVNVCYGFNSNGGSEVVCRNLAESFAKNGHNVSVLSIDSYSHDEMLNGVHVYYFKTFVGSNRGHSLGVMKGFYIRFCRFYSIFDYYKYKKFIKDGNYDVVNTHCIEDISPVIWKAAHDADVRIVHTMHERYLKCHMLFMLKNNGSLCDKQTVLCKFRNIYYKRYIKMVDMFISPSKHLAKDMKVNSHIIYNGVKKPNISNFDAIINERKREHIILFAGNLRLHKGINVLIEAFEKLDSKWNLYIAGDGPLFDDLKDSTRNMKNVCMFGRLNGDQMNELYKKAFVLVLPSICKENCPMVVLEAFSYRVPVIGSNIGGNVELIEDKINGFLFENKNSNDLVDKLLMLDSMYDTLIENLQDFKGFFENQVEEYLWAFNDL